MLSIYPYIYLLTNFSILLHMVISCYIISCHIILCRWIALTKASSSTSGATKAERESKSEGEVSGIMLVPVPSSQKDHQVGARSTDCNSNNNSYSNIPPVLSHLISSIPPSPLLSYPLLSYTFRHLISSNYLSRPLRDGDSALVTTARSSCRPLCTTTN